MSDEHADDAAFLACRPRLMGVAYGMLGTRGEAEDVVQDAWLRWRAAGREAVRDAEAFLVRVTTRLALDALGSARARRETYVGPWLPEPVLTSVGPGTTCDPASAVEAAEELSLALLAALERLDPVQRAVFLLRDIFDYDDISDAVEKTPANCRQIARRAREAVGQARRRFPVDARQEERLLVAFATAVGTGDLAALTELLADDAVLWSDGGGLVTAARKPIYGQDKVARFILGVSKKAPEGTTLAVVHVNGDPGWQIDGPDGVVAVLVLEPGDGVIANVRVINTPEKLRRV